MMLEGDNRRMQSIHKSKKEDGDVMDGSVTSVRDHHPCALMILLTLTCSMHFLSVLYFLLESLSTTPFYAILAHTDRIGTYMNGHRIKATARATLVSLSRGKTYSEAGQNLSEPAQVIQEGHY
jgi:hypothetical protein